MKPILSILFIPGLLISIALNANEVQDKSALELDKIIYLEQNWTEEDRKWFYTIDQGSRLIPYRIFINLEQSGNQELFRDPLYMMKFGFLASRYNPDNLPIGFTRNKHYMGITCAACHTQQIKYQDQFIHIDGGQAMMDLPMFLMELEQALQATWQSTDKYNRFEQRVLGKKPTEKAKSELKSEFKQTLDERSLHNVRNHSNQMYGYSRLDAFGNILNKGLLLTGVKDNFNMADAPTSYPYIWDTPQHDYVEWNGSQSNSSVGALARNIGEVIGVFGHVDAEPTKILGVFDAGYKSSIQTRNLRKIEMKVSELHSPLWPELFPEIDQVQAKQGRALYETHCLSCHQDIQRDDPNRYIKVRMSTLKHIKTDPLMAENAIKLRGKSGIFQGKPRYYKAGPELGEEDFAIYIVNNIMGGVLTNNPIQSLLAKRDAKKLGQPDGFRPPKYVDGKIIETGQESSEQALLAYKARPLNGIWTAGPYLHNGSVPNLYELMLPAEKRSKTFYIGAWDFDPVKVGYVDEYRDGSFLFDTTLKGNSNAGHEYATGKDGAPALTKEEIWSLVEYMKTL